VNRDEALARLQAHNTEIKRFGVRSLDLFGSVARNEAGPESDLDLIVEFEGSATYDRYIGLKMLLEDLLGCRVDLVTARAMKPRMRSYVERDAVHVA
jgi:predicted nucleotidyltransferase